MTAVKAAPAASGAPRAAIPATTGRSQRRLFGLRFGTRPGVGVGDAGKAVAEDVSALVRAEIALAKAEVRSGLKEKGAGAGAFAVAGALAWLGVQGLLITAALLLALVLPLWAAALIVTLALLAGAAGAAAFGRRKMARPVSLATTKGSVAADVAVAKAHLRTPPPESSS